MRCPYCKNENSRVLDKRSSSDTAIRRRRQCEKCERRFTTYERIENVVLNVLKRDGRVEEFDREKLKRGIMKAVKKRTLSESVVEEMITEIEQQLITCNKELIKSVEIGELVLQKLTQIDKLGALLFASVYKEFQSLEDVQNELERLAKKGS